jgi:hypothetical protein
VGTIFENSKSTGFRIRYWLRMQRSFPPQLPRKDVLWIGVSHSVPRLACGVSSHLYTGVVDGCVTDAPSILMTDISQRSARCQVLSLSTLWDSCSFPSLEMAFCPFYYEPKRHFHSVKHRLEIYLLHEVFRNGFESTDTTAPPHFAINVMQ